MRRKLQTMEWIAALLCCAVLWATPVMAQQAYNLWIGGVQVTSENCNYIDKEHGFPAVKEGSLLYIHRASSKTLVMNNATITANDVCIRNENDLLFITVNGSNTLEGACGIKSFGYLNIRESGTLTIKATETGISVGDSNNSGRAALLSIADCKLNIEAKYGIKGVNKNERISPETEIHIKSTQEGITNVGEFDATSVRVLSPKNYAFEDGALMDKDAGKVAAEIDILPKLGLYIAGKEVSSENSTNISKENGFESVEIAQGGEFRYDQDKNILFMKGVTVTAGDGVYALVNYSLKQLIIRVSGENHLNATTASALFCNADTRIEGDGKLDVKSDKAAVFLHAKTYIHDIEFYAHGKTWGIFGKNRTDDVNDNFFLRGAKGKIRGDVGAIGNLSSIDENLTVIIKPEDGLYFNDNQDDTHPANFVERNDPTQPLKEIEFDRAYKLKINSKNVHALNCSDLSTNNADYGIPGVVVAAEGHCYYDLASKTLFLKNVTINAAPDQNCITNFGIDGLTIKVEGENTLIGDNAGIMHNVSTQIIGDGTLTIKTHYGFYYDRDEQQSNNITFNISDINLNIEVKKNIGLFYEEACFHSHQVEYAYTLNNVKATFKDKPYYMVNPILKGCKVVSAEGVLPIEIDRIAIANISFSPAEITRYVGDAPAAVPQPTVNPEDAGNKRMKWTSDNEEVAKVNEEGMLIVGRKGTAHLTATTTDGTNKEATLTVQALYRVEGVKLYQGTEEVSALTVTKGAPFTLTAKVVPENTPGGVEWEFQAEEFTVTDKTTEKATFTALKVGDYTITARAVEDNEKTATVNVKVLLATPTAIAIAEADKAFELKKDKSKEITLNFTPAEHVNKEVNVTVAPKEALTASVTDGKLTIKADKPFDKDTQVTVTVTSKVAPSVSTSCTVTLKYEKPGAVEDAALESMIVAPNPFTSQLRISNPEGVEARYELVNTLGVVVRGGALQGVETVLNTENLNAGVYLLRLLSGTSSKTLRVVKE